MPTLRVKGLDAPLEVEEGADLLSACRAGRVNLFWGPWARLFNCRGVGLCTLCKVDVMDGAENLAPRTKREDKRLRRSPDHWRLACQAQVKGDVTIDPFPLVPIEEQVSAEAMELARLPLDERRQLAREAKEAALSDDAPPTRERKPLLARFRKAKGDEDDPAAEKDSEGNAPAAPDAAPRKRSRFARRGKEATTDDAGAPSGDADKAAERRAKAEAKEAKRRAKEDAKAAKRAKKGSKEEEPAKT